MSNGFLFTLGMMMFIVCVVMMQPIGYFEMVLIFAALSAAAFAVIRRWCKWINGLNDVDQRCLNSRKFYITTAIVVYIFLAAFSVFLNVIPFVRSGPSSLEGLEVRVVIEDHMIFTKAITAGFPFDPPGKDYYHNVQLLDDRGNVLCEVKDVDGMGLFSSTSEMISSMTWVSKDRLEFQLSGDEYVFLREMGKKWVVR